jgi:hypothetical protein
MAGYACSWIPLSFCNTCDGWQSYSVISGVIIDTVPHGIRLSIIDVLRGNEHRDTIIIWDGTDINCNGIFPMDAKGLGHRYLSDTTIIGDSIIVVMPMIDSIENTWDVMGDYRRPSYLPFEPNLDVINDTVRGYISGYPVVERALLKMSYSTFKSHWFANNMQCSDLVSVEEIENSIQVYPTLVRDQISIQATIKDYSVHLFSVTGIKMESGESITRIDMTGYPSGLYIVEVEKGDAFFRKKIVKW